METNELPTVLPIFPLTGILLLPGAHVPLHIFEPRYRNMVEDVLEGEGVFGLIQPLRPAQDHAPDLAEPASGETVTPELYTVGCAGVIDFSEKLADGRWVVLVRGARRFRVEGELPLYHGYRRVAVAYDDFDVDTRDLEAEIDPERLISALRTFGETQNVTLDLDKLTELPGRSLLNSMAMALPFAPAEKQALLEAPDIHRRYEMLLALMKMGMNLPSDDVQAPPVLN